MKKAICEDRGSHCEEACPHFDVHRIISFDSNNVETCVNHACDCSLAGRETICNIVDDDDDLKH